MFLNLDLHNYLNLFAQYVLSPSIIGSVILFGLSKILKLGEIKKDFETIKADVAELKKKSGSIITNITVIKTHLVDKQLTHPTSSICVFLHNRAL